MIRLINPSLLHVPGYVITITVNCLLIGCGSPQTDPDIPWPTSGWAVSSPAQQGLEPQPFAELDSAIRSGKYGYIDRMVVVRSGYMVVNERYPHDYHSISPGLKDAMGCSPDMCDEPGASHDFNYYHPDTHPYYRGRDVHTLQSVTAASLTSFFPPRARTKSTRQSSCRPSRPMQIPT